MRGERGGFRDIARREAAFGDELLGEIRAEGVFPEALRPQFHVRLSRSRLSPKRGANKWC